MILKAAVLGSVAQIGISLLAAQDPAINPGHDFALQDEFLKIAYHTATGRMDIVWHNGNQLMGLESGVELADGRALVTSLYPMHDTAFTWRSSTTMTNNRRQSMSRWIASIGSYLQMWPLSMLQPGNLPVPSTEK